MKRAILAMAMTAVCSLANAQTFYDALDFSENNYYGTARTIGMGNAFTAVGSDLGSIAINPAGSAVAGYSQISISPGISISSSASSYAPSYIPGLETICYGAPNRDSYTKFLIPNVGFTLQYETGSNTGLKSFTFGFLSNLSNNFNALSRAVGNTEYTSITGSFARAANEQGMAWDILDYSEPFNSPYTWNEITSYFAKGINYNSASGRYFGSGVGEGELTPGTLSQVSSKQTSGIKNDIIFNFGFNFEDRLYFGVNIGLSSGTYDYGETFRESPYDYKDFPITPMGCKGGYPDIEASTFYTGTVYKYNYIARQSGVYGKFGFIYLPSGGLRIGAAIQTPTVLSVSENWQVYSETNFKNDRQSAYWSSPEGQYSYALRTPYEINAGIAYTFGHLGMISADYEMNDFSIMEYRSGNDGMSSNFSEVNKLNRLFGGVSHSLRLGGELNLVQGLSARAGYNFVTNPEREYTDNHGNVVRANDYAANFKYFESTDILRNKHYLGAKAWTHRLSAGLGYSSEGPFFADFAVRWTKFPKTTYTPYSDYLNTELGDASTVLSPTVQLSRSLWDVVMTIGLRF